MMSDNTEREVLTYKVNPNVKILLYCEKMCSNCGLIQFTNCRILREHKITKEDLWIRNGKIENPLKIFFDEKIESDRKIDCKNAIIAPGFIDLQINGAFGVDFSSNTENVQDGVSVVAKKLLSTGVTSFCPTVVTSPQCIYHAVLPQIKKRAGGVNGAGVLGVHLEGPFISKEKKGAHPLEHIKDFKEGFKTVVDTYGDLENVRIVTLAPELPEAHNVIKSLTKLGVTVSVGHSTANLTEGEQAVRNGAGFITHLFNAMLPFHHRDPGLIGLLTTNRTAKNKTIYYGIISDGVHTHPAALRIAYKAHPNGLVLVTDAISAMGLENGTHQIGQLAVDVKEHKAFVAGTQTLCGSIAPMDECVRVFLKATGCTVEYALEAASLRPAMVLGLENRKGSLSYGCDADFVVLNDGLEVLATWIAGKCVFQK